MWGSRAATWSDNPVRAGSMKWHLIDEESLEERNIEVGYSHYKRTITRTYGLLMCGGKKEENHIAYRRDGSFWYDTKIPLVFKEYINISQANICAYCKKYRMKQLGIESQKI